MNIYIAGSFGAKPKLHKLAKQVETLGHTVTSRWLESHDHSFGTEQDAHEDLTDIVNSELMILDTFEPSTTGGRDVELGYALGLAKRVWLVGPQTNLFQHLVKGKFAHWDDVLNRLEGTKGE